MKLDFQNQYKSIPSGGEASLQRFSLLTGLNGSGKSHLLQSISEGQTLVTDEDGTRPATKYLHSIDLVPTATPQSNPNAARQAYTLLSQWSDQLIQQGAGIADEAQYTRRNPPRVNDPRQRRLFPILHRLLKTSFDEEKRVLTRFDVMNAVTFDELEQFDDNSAFHQKFSNSFLRYFADQEENEIANFLVSKGRQGVQALSETEFHSLKGRPPWDLINNMMSRMDLPYKINQPTSADASFVARLTNTQNGATIDFSDLSSGEQVLCSVAIALYQMDSGSAFPGLLMLDELDAHLHPKMMGSVLDVVNNEILPELSCGLIVTTHSPTTCVLAPPGSIYKMDRASRRPVRCSTDDALKLLSVGVPITIRKEDDRQVVVESDADASVYEGLFATLRRFDDRFGSGPNLNFVSSTTGWRTGSCEHATRICAAFRIAGSTSTFALIDHDNTNSTNEPIFVAGEGERYSIENFMYGPTSISALLIHYLGRDSVELPEYLHGFGNGSIGGLDQAAQQAITDAFCLQITQSVEAARSAKDLANKFPELDFENDTLMQVTDLAGRAIQVPGWFLKCNGHKLEEALIYCFPRLRQFGNEAGKLLNEVRLHVFDSSPGMIPSALANSFAAIQTSTE